MSFKFPLIPLSRSRHAIQRDAASQIAAAIKVAPNYLLRKLFPGQTLRMWEQFNLVVVVVVACKEPNASRLRVFYVRFYDVRPERFLLMLTYL